jgi:hypothetical protein
MSDSILRDLQGAGRDDGFEGKHDEALFGETTRQQKEQEEREREKSSKKAQAKYRPAAPVEGPVPPLALVSPRKHGNITPRRPMTAQLGPLDSARAGGGSSRARDRIATARKFAL